MAVGIGGNGGEHAMLGVGVHPGFDPAACTFDSFESRHNVFNPQILSTPSRMAGTAALCSV